MNDPQNAADGPKIRCEVNTIILEEGDNKRVLDALTKHLDRYRKIQVARQTKTPWHVLFHNKLGRLLRLFVPPPGFGIEWKLEEGTWKIIVFPGHVDPTKLRSDDGDLPWTRCPSGDPRPVL